MARAFQAVFLGFVVLILLSACAATEVNTTSSPPTDTPVSATSLPEQTPFPVTDPSPSDEPLPTELPATATDQPPDFIDLTVAFTEDLIAEDAFSGVVLVARSDEVIFEAAGGLANRELNIPNNPETQFNMGSMTKMFTAVAILQLVEAGQLALDDSIADLLPDYSNPDVASQVTVHHLLTHTSGLGDIFTEQFFADPHRYRETMDFLPLFVEAPLSFPPSGAFSYSNAGYVVLGLIIEELTGQRYDEYVTQSIFAPAGMVRTGSYDIEDAAPDRAIGYTMYDSDYNETGELNPNSIMMPGRGFAAGGFFTTAEDMFLFGRALFGYQLLSPELTEMLITGKVEDRVNSHYAYGFFDRLEAGRRMVGHTGGAPGVCSFLNTYPETDTTVVVLSNSDDGCLAILDFLRNTP